MKKIFLIAAAAIILVSCENNDDNILSSKNPVRITATIGESLLSRAKDVSWTAGDKIGISSSFSTASGTVKEPYINVEYTNKDGGGEFEGAHLYFYKPMTLIAYYPYTGVEGTAPGIGGVIKAVTRAENQKPEKQPQIDFLWDAKTNQDQKDFSATDNTVNFTFTHKMSKLTFAFKGSDKVVNNGIVIAPEVKVSDVVSYEIEGLVMDGTFDTTTGICAIDNDVEPQNLKIDLTNSTLEDGKSLPPLIVFPQKPGNNSVKLHVYTDELDNSDVLQHYICTLTFGDGELKPGNSYKYTIQITKVGLILGEMSIEKWNNERDVNLTATVDGGWKTDEQK